MAEGKISKPNCAIFIDEITMPNSIADALIPIDMRGYSSHIILGASFHRKDIARWDLLPVGVDNGLAYLNSAGNNYRPFITSQNGVTVVGGQKVKIVVLLFN